MQICLFLQASTLLKLNCLLDDFIMKILFNEIEFGKQSSALDGHICNKHYASLSLKWFNNGKSIKNTCELGLNAFKLFYFPSTGFTSGST